MSLQQENEALRMQIAILTELLTQAYYLKKNLLRKCGHLLLLYMFVYCIIHLLFVRF
jgi:uncharacterized membrane protein YGL010W